MRVHKRPRAQIVLQFFSSRTNNEHVRRPLNLLHGVRGLIVNSLTKNYSAELHGNFRFTPITRLMGLFSESGRRNYVPDRLERRSQSARGKR